MDNLESPGAARDFLLSNEQQVFDILKIWNTLKTTTNYFLPLEPGAYYHIYNRGNNGENIFYKKENYLYFLRKFDQYLAGYLDVQAYGLLPNHFHFLVKTKTREQIEEHLLYLKSGIQVLENFSAILSEEFRRFFLSYAKSIKVQEGRTGSLFEKNFKRIQINNGKHLFWLFNYIHRNPQTHGLVDDFRKWRFSSYASMLSKAPTKICRDEVLRLFGGEREFVRFHLTNPVNKGADILSLE